MKLTVRGVIFALFPHYSPTDPRGEEMVKQTVQHLKLLDHERPEVILVPEPENLRDPKAVRVYCEGSPIGYVAHEQTNEAQQLFDEVHSMVPARIVQVEAEDTRQFHIEADVPESARQGEPAKGESVNAWKDWQCSVPKFPMPADWQSCRVLEYLIDNQFPVHTLEQVKNLRTYIKLWMEKSLHDFSVEAMQQRKRYIERLRGIRGGALEAEVMRLEKQYVAICCGERMMCRMKWWTELQHSTHMEIYWDRWRSSRQKDNLWYDLYMVDTQLRRMPGDLYAHIGDLACLFAALRYRDDVTRSVLRDIYTLLLLRERICRELGIDMKPLPADFYGVEGEVEPITPKAKETCRPTEPEQDKGTETKTKSLFYDIVQHESPDKLIERLHQLMDGRKGADVGCVLLKCMQDGLITRKPKQKEFESEFALIGGWTAIHNYMDENSEKALDRANKVIVF